MNKTQFKKVLSLHKDGVPPHTCTMVILQLMIPDMKLPDPTILREAATQIDKFYSLITNFPDSYMEKV